MGKETGLGLELKPETGPGLSGARRTPAGRQAQPDAILIGPPPLLSRSTP